MQELLSTIAAFLQSMRGFRDQQDALVQRVLDAAFRGDSPPSRQEDTDIRTAALNAAIRFDQELQRIASQAPKGTMMSTEDRQLMAAQLGEALELKELVVGRQVWALVQEQNP